MTKEQKIWFDEKSREVWDTGWRRHGASVGDKVILRCWYDAYEIEDTNIEIDDGAIGEILQLMNGDAVSAVFYYFNELGNVATVEICCNVENDVDWCGYFEIYQEEKPVIEYKKLL